MDFNQKFFFHLWMCTSWLTARLEISTSFILFSIAILCVSLRSEISPVALGLALTYGLQLNALFQRVVQVTIDIMSYMISTERVLEYCEIDSEPSIVPVFQDVQCISEKNTMPKSNDLGMQASSSDKKDSISGKIRNRSKSVTGQLPANWPSEGIVQFDNVWMQYRDNPAVLKGISFKTQPAMRIGKKFVSMLFLSFQFPPFTFMKELLTFHINSWIKYHYEFPSIYHLFFHSLSLLRVFTLSSPSLYLYLSIS